MTEHAVLPLQTLRAATLGLVRAESHANLDDSALDVFTDLRVAPAVIAPATEPLGGAERLMQQGGVRMAFVADAAGGIVGLVTLADLHGERPAQVARLRSVSSADVTVGEVMLPLAEWPALDYEQVARASIGRIAATLRAAGQRYLIVTEAMWENTPHGPRTAPAIRGLFSANRIERALGHPIETELRSQNFAQLHAALADH